MLKNNKDLHIEFQALAMLDKSLQLIYSLLAWGLFLSFVPYVCRSFVSSQVREIDLCIHSKFKSLKIQFTFDFEIAFVEFLHLALSLHLFHCDSSWRRHSVPSLKLFSVLVASWPLTAFSSMSSVKMSFGISSHGLFHYNTDFWRHTFLRDIVPRYTYTHVFMLYHMTLLWQ